jgi:hypothetical protein
MIGSTDSHLSLSAVEESNFFGKFGVNEPSATQLDPGPESAIRYAAAGYAAVWAQENTREALFDAMQRKEVYGSNGPRIVLRFFGGWDFDEQDHQRPDFVTCGYKKGVPMGADLGAGPNGAMPGFLVSASKDPDGANLDRSQIVKGWLDDRGDSHEKVYDIALSDDRLPDSRTGDISPLQSTVDIKSVSHANSIGDASLGAVWFVRQFDPGQRAFY